MKASKSGYWNSADTKAWVEQTLKFLAPYVIVLIPVIIGQIPADWGYATIVIWVLNRALSAFLLLKAGK